MTRFKFISDIKSLFYMQALKYVLLTSFILIDYKYISKLFILAYLMLNNKMKSFYNIQGGLLCLI